MSDPAPANGRDTPDAPRPFVRRVCLRNYKSIRVCDVELAPLTVLVGRNGAGKSNFLDALGFVGNALGPGGLGRAFEVSGTLRSLLYQQRPPGDDVLAFTFDLSLGEGRTAVYHFELGPRSQRQAGYRTIRESASIRDAGGVEIDRFTVEQGRTLSSCADVQRKPLSDESLYLSWAGVGALGPAFLDLYRGLNQLAVYHFNTAAMRALQEPNALLLRRDGSNLPSVLARLVAEPWGKDLLLDYLRVIVPGIMDVDRVAYGSFETVRFRQQVRPGAEPLEFDAAAMSEGTLRALGILVAVAQLADGDNPVRLVGIEEPETALHPAAAGALMDALRESADGTQVIVTTHSPDLLDQIDLETDHLLVAEAREEGTVIAPINRASREAIREHLYSPGELLRMDQFRPDHDDLQRQLRDERKLAGRTE